jgi:hypothetical protein
VPLGITDPVQQARAELKAALSAIEVKANVPRRLGRAIDERTAQAKAFAKKNPALAAVAAVGVAVALGAAVWGAVRLYVK